MIYHVMQWWRDNEDRLRFGPNEFYVRADSIVEVWDVFPGREEPHWGWIITGLEIIDLEQAAAKKPQPLADGGFDEPA